MSTAAESPASEPPASALACWLLSPGTAALREEVLPPCGPDSVRVRALHSGVSRGTEALVFRGEVPESEYQRMRAPWQAGAFPAPVKYGYSSVGIVEDGPAGLLGRPVFCLYPHQSRYVVPASAVHPLPEGLAPARAVLAANMETAINAVWDAPPRVGQRVAVVGGGVLGLLVGWLAARVPGCVVELVDAQPARAPVAQALGMRFTPAGEVPARGDADLVFHTSGQGAGLATALGLAGHEATVLELSWYGSRPVQVPLGEAFHARRLRLQSSQVGQVATAQRARWSHGQRLALALQLLADPVLDVLVNAHAPFAQLPAVLARLAAGDAPEVLCQRIDYL